jgi:hypothetical protein
MRGADEEFVQSLAYDVQMDRTMTQRARKTTMQLLYTVTAAIFGVDAARRIFSVNWLKDDPNVQQLIRELHAEGEARGLAKGEARGLAKGMVRGRAEGVVRGRAEGVAKEARVALRKVLAARSFRESPEVRDRIDRQRSIARLEAWLEAAVNADSIDEVFTPAGHARAKHAARPQRATRSTSAARRVPTARAGSSSRRASQPR